jgi:hypothetical protein
VWDSQAMSLEGTRKHEYEDVGNWWGDVGKTTENWRSAINEDEEKN